MATAHALMTRSGVAGAEQSPAVRTGSVGEWVLTALVITGSSAGALGGVAVGAWAAPAADASLGCAFGTLGVMLGGAAAVALDWFVVRPVRALFRR